jgi:hypothetical protein
MRCNAGKYRNIYCLMETKTERIRTIEDRRDEIRYALVDIR